MAPSDDVGCSAPQKLRGHATAGDPLAAGSPCAKPGPASLKTPATTAAGVRPACNAEPEDGQSVAELASGTQLQNGSFVLDRLYRRDAFSITYLAADTAQQRAAFIEELCPPGSLRVCAQIE